MIPRLMLLPMLIFTLSGCIVTTVGSAAVGVAGTAVGVAGKAAKVPLKAAGKVVARDCAGQPPRHA